MKLNTQDSLGNTSTLERVGAVAAAIAAVSIGVLQFVNRVADTDDATAHLLRSEANRDALLASIEQDRQGETVAHPLFDA